MGDLRRTRSGLTALIGGMLLAGTLVTGCASDDSDPDDAAPSESDDIELEFTQEPAPPDLAAQVLPPGEPIARWVDESTLRVVWAGLMWCPASPVAISHDGAGTYRVDLEDDTEPQGACDLAAQVVVTTFSGVPHDDNDGIVVVLHGPEDGQSIEVPVS